MPQNDRRIQRSFTGGEQSPNLDSRADLERFATSLAIEENFVSLPWGGAERCPGSRFILPALPNSRLIEFAASDSDGYAIEFGTGPGGDIGEMRLFRDYGFVESAPGSGLPFQMPTPFDATEIPNLYPAQFVDAMYIASGTQPIEKLKRNSSTSWAFTSPEFRRGPFLDLNGNANLYLYSTDAPEYEIGDPIDVFARGGTPFSADMEGGLLLIRTGTAAKHGTWEPSVEHIDIGTYTVWNGNIYLCTDTIAGKTGVNPPVHTVPGSTAWDGMNIAAQNHGCKWAFLHDGYGIVRIDTFVDAGHVQCTVRKHVPDDLSGDGGSGGTINWAEGAWSPKNGYPTVVEFHGDRLLAGFTKSQPNIYWASALNDFENFDEGKGLDEDAFSRPLLGNNKLHAGRWIVSGQRAAFGTSGDEFVIQGSSTREALTPDNATTLPATSEGSEFVRPVKVGSPIWVAAGGRRVHLLGYDFQTDDFDAPDLTESAEHVTLTGVKGLAWQRHPYGVVWAYRGDGTLISMTYRKQQQVIAWARHPRLGRVRSMAAVPNPDGVNIDLWMTVEQDLASGTKAYIECQERFFNQGALDLTLSRFVECGLMYDGAPATIITGLAHLEGLDVGILADGQAKPDQTVQGGAIALDRAASRVVVGRTHTPRMTSLRYDRDFDGGASSGRMRRVPGISIDVINAVGLRVSAGIVTSGGELAQPTAGLGMNVPPALGQGVLGPVPVPDRPNVYGQFTVLAHPLFPATLRSWTPNVQVAS